MSTTSSHEDFARAAKDFVARLFDNVGYGQAVEEALDRTQKREQRDCPLKAHLVVTLVVAMSLFRELSIPGVMREMIDWLRDKFPKLELKAVTDGAPLKARQRLGPEPMLIVFNHLARQAPKQPSFHGLFTHTVDAVRLNMPDTPDNAEQFGRWKASKGSPTAFAQMMAVALIETGHRNVRDVIFNRCDDAERPCCEEFLSLLGEKDLLLIDRGYHALWLFASCFEKGVHFLCRASSSYKPRIIQVLGRGDYLVELRARVPLSPEECQATGKKTRRLRMVLRMIVSQVGKKKAVRILTDLLDPKEYPAREFARFYHERWECEIAHDELKTHLAAVSGGSLDLPFRSKSSEGVLQEAYGLFIAYNIVRHIMAEGATKAGIPPRYISFVESLQVIRKALPRFERASASDIPRLSNQLLADIAACKLDRPRRPRVYPRVIRVKIKHFPRKRPEHCQEVVDIDRDLRLTDSDLGGFAKA